jgi:hypothetical protein
MKASRIIIMAVGIALFIFMIAPFTSAQSVWLKGKISLKGYNIDDNLNEITGKGSGALSLYVNIVENTDDFTVTTCSKNETTVTDDDWILVTRNLPKTKVWGGCDDQNGVIFDFSGEPAQSFAFSTGKENFMTFPVFSLKCKGDQRSFKSFACKAYVLDTSTPNEHGIGSCSISLKSIDPLKVPTGPNGCIITP